MKSIFTLLTFFSFASVGVAQTTANNYGYHSRHTTDVSKVNLNGQWRGNFYETSMNMFGYLDTSSTRYVLELDVKGSYVTGYSYTYFNYGDNRYYTICRVTGAFNRRSNDLIVTEVERIKHNTPPNINNYFQVHKLHYVKGNDNTEYLRGKWEAAPGQMVNAGNGTTILSRKIVSRTPFAIKLPPKKEEPITAKTTPPKKQHPTEVTVPKPKEEKRPSTTIASGIPVEREEMDKPGMTHKVQSAKVPVFKDYENRKNNIVKTIKIEQPVFQVDFYDNGEIDGDSISVFFNGKLILSHKKLTDKPLTLTLSVDRNLPQNVITMYAENLGTIPPNTALMIVRDGDKRYEVRMESDLGKSGTVVFTHEDQ